MKRTKLVDRKLPGFTRNEEIGNMITHIVGGAFGFIVLLLCTVFSSYPWHNTHARTRFLFADLPLNVVNNTRNTQSIPVFFA